MKRRAPRQVVIRYVENLNVYVTPDAASDLLDQVAKAGGRRRSYSKRNGFGSGEARRAEGAGSNGAAAEKDDLLYSKSAPPLEGAPKGRHPLEGDPVVADGDLAREERISDGQKVEFQEGSNGSVIIRGPKPLTEEEKAAVIREIESRGLGPEGASALVSQFLGKKAKVAIVTEAGVVFDAHQQPAAEVVHAEVEGPF